MTTTYCATPDDLAAYGDGSLSEDRAAVLERHLAECSQCAARLDEIERAPRAGILQAMRGLAGSESAGIAPSIDPYRTVAPVDPVPLSPAAEKTRLATAPVEDTSFPRDAARPAASMSPDEFDLSRGPIVFGRYELQKKLGEGGMGAVFLATDTVLGRNVAIKIPFLSSRREREDLLKRFRREARCAAALEHPNICAVYDVGEIDGRPYMAMAYIPGRPLSDFVKAKGEIPVKVALQVAQRLAKTLEHAHARGVLHRDLKPSNIQFSDRKEPVVMDFGLARLEADHKAEPLTRSGDIVGTPAYMPPEQLAGRHSEMGPWSDVYSLGVILYQLLTKRRPFDGELFELVHKIANEKADPPSRHRADVGPHVDALVLRCLEKNPRARYQSMAEFAQAIGECLKALDQGASSTTGAGIALAAPETSLSPRAGTDASPSLTDPSTVRFSKPPIPQRPHSESPTPPSPAGRDAVRTDPSTTPTTASSSASATASTTIPDAPADPFAAIAEAAMATPTLPARPAPQPNDARPPRSTEDGADRSLASRTRRAPSVAPSTRSVVRKAGSKPSRGFRAPPWLKHPLVPAAAFAAALLLGVVLFVRTPKGTLRVELEDPAIEVRVAGENVILTGADPKPIRLTPGEKSFKVKRGDFEFDTTSIVLRKNETVTARVEMVDGELRMTADGQEIGRGSPSGGATRTADAAANPDSHSSPASKSPSPREIWTPTPEFQAWMDGVAKLPPTEQVKAVAARMKELNPGFDGSLNPSFGPDGNVQGINISHSTVADISPIRALAHVNLVWFERCKVPDLSPLKGLRLVSLNCIGNPVTDLSPLSGMPLEWFACAMTNVSDLRPLQGMKLKKLFMDGCSVRDLIPLRGMPLEVLHAANSPIDDITALQEMPLASLNLWMTKVSDLSPVRGMPLRSLWLPGVPPKDLSPLEKLPLEILEVSDKSTLRFEDLRPLLGRLPIKEISLHGKGFSDIAPLKGLSLRGLGLVFGSEVVDLSPLREMPLEHLVIHSNRVADFSPLADCPLVSITAKFVPARDAAPLRSIKTLKTINDKPAAEFLKESEAGSTKPTSSPASSPVAPAPPVFPNDPERTAAAWALSRGGAVRVLHKSGDRHLTRLDELPAEGPLRVLAITVSNSKVVTDAELQVLASLKAITWLELNGNANVTDAGLEHLAGLTTLQRLGLKGASLRGPGLRHLAGLSKLQYLALANAPLEDASFQTLGAFPELKTLDLTGTRIGASGLERFASDAKVASLNLASCKIGAAEMRAVSRMPLEILSLEYAVTTDEALNELNAPELKRLLLGQTKIADGGLRDFSRFRKLDYLSLDGTNVSDEGLRELEGLSTLTFLGVGATRVTDQGLSTIARMKSVKHLNLGRLKLTATGLTNLKALPLQVANLDGVTLDREAARAVGSWSRIENLVLSGTSLTDDGLAEFTKLSKLRLLDVSRTKVTAAGVANLKKALPLCQVTWDGSRVAASDSAPVEGTVGTLAAGWPTGAPEPAVAPFDAAQAKRHQEEWAAYLKVPVEYENSVGMKFRLVPPGSYLRGAGPGDLREIEAMKARYPNDPNADRATSETPRHGIAITRPFYVGVHEVTQKEYESVLGKNPSAFFKGGKSANAVEGLDTADFPVESVTSADAAQFCSVLSVKEKRTPSYLRFGDAWAIQDAAGYRLPTEAEWEFFCRAGTATIYWSGDRKEDVARSDCVGEPPLRHEQRAYPVGERDANPFGLFDVHGNVRELCQDGWVPNVYATRGGGPDPATTLRNPATARGGCYVFSGFTARSAARASVSQAQPITGFRVVLPIAVDKPFALPVPAVPAGEGAKPVNAPKPAGATSSSPPAAGFRPAFPAIEASGPSTAPNGSSPTAAVPAQTSPAVRSVMRSWPRSAGPLAPGTPKTFSAKDLPVTTIRHFTFTPLFRYEIDAMVIAKKHYPQTQWNDFFPWDLGVAWGRLSDPDAHSQRSSWVGPPSCVGPRSDPRQ